MNDHLASEGLDYMVHLPDKWGFVTSPTDLTRQQREWLKSQGETESFRLFARNPGTSLSQIDELARHSDGQVRSEVAARLDLTPELQRRLSLDDDFWVQ